MDRSSEKEKPSRKSREEREREREREKERHRSKDHHHRHRSEEREGAESGGDEDYHHHRNREPEVSKNRSSGSRRSKDDRVRYDDDDNGYRRSRGHSHERESRGEHERDSRRERGGSRDRIYGRESERERSMEREGSRERSHEPSHTFKRKDREEEIDASEKRTKRERGWFEEKPDGEFRDSSDVAVKEERGDETNLRNEGRREKRKFEDRDREELRVVKKEDGEREHGNGRRRERRKFEDLEVKEEEEEGVHDRNRSSSLHDNSAPNKLGGSSANSNAMGPPASNLKNVAPINPPSSKVSSIFTTNENKGVSITGSHAVTGKSSTDGAATVAGKSGNLSLDALAKAKKALQMQKELAQKLKNLPKLNKSANSVANSKEQASSTVESKPPSNGGLLSMQHGQSVSAAAYESFPSTPAGVSSVLPFGGMDAAKVEAVRRAQELAAKMGFHHDSQFGPLINLFPGQAPQETTVPQKPTKAPVLRLDALGREIDEHGNLVNVPKINNLSTLKVNINKQKKDAFQILKPELDVDPEQNPHYDPRMGIDKNKILRPKRMSFQFVEEGKWSKDAEIVKLKSQFGEAQAKELKAKQAQFAKAKAEPNINPNLIEIGERVIINKEKPKQVIPEVEWWDIGILRSGNYGDLADNEKIEGLIRTEKITSYIEDMIKTEKITIYIEHPRPIEPPAEPAPPPPQPLKLTKKEQKKLRTQRRLAREKERQEMIRQGLIEPPKPKVKMSNLMKVLGSEATQDPTRMEKEIRTAAAEREQAHIDRNIARKLTPAEKREKKERKLFEDPTTLETIVSVYKVNDLSHPQNRFKVDVNAQENRMSGCAVLFEGFSVVVVEGGSKSIKRYGKLMLRRINWAAKLPTEDEDDAEDGDKPPNKCSLVWQGSVAKPSFNRFFVHECRTEAAARKVFADAGVGHYWDLASNFTDDQD